MKELSKLEEKITTPQEVLDAFKPVRCHYPLVTTNGCFDLLHIGHIRSLAFSAQHSPYVVVLVNSDASVRRLKGHTRPIQSQHERTVLLASIVFVWRVVVFEQDSPVSVLQLLKPNIHVKGREYAGQAIPELDVLSSYGGKMMYVDTSPDVSTSTIIERIKEEHSHRKE